MPTNIDPVKIMTAAAAQFISGMSGLLAAQTNLSGLQNQVNNLTNLENSLSGQNVVLTAQNSILAASGLQLQNQILQDKVTISGLISSSGVNSSGYNTLLNNFNVLSGQYQSAKSINVNLSGQISGLNAVNSGLLIQSSGYLVSGANVTNQLAALTAVLDSQQQAALALNQVLPVPVTG